MTDPAPPSQPLDYQPPSRESGWPALVAWIVIIGCTVTLMVVNILSYHRQAAKGGENPTTLMQVNLAGKAAVGLNQLLKEGQTDPSPWNNVQTMVTTIEQTAKTPEEKLRTITVVADVNSANEAFKDLDKLNESKLPAEVADDLTALRTIYSTKNPASLDESTRQRLIDRYDFFGRLAVTFNQPPTDPQRAAVLAEARRTANHLIYAGVLGSALVIVIFCAFVTAIVLVAMKKIRPTYAPQRWANSAYLEAFAIYLGGFILMSLLLRMIAKNALPLEWLALIFIPISIGWVHFRGESIRQAAFGLGWFWGRGPLIEIPLGIFGYLACVPLVAIGFGISIFLTQLVGATPSHPIEQMLGGSRWEIVNLFGIACIMAPVLEETMFRGALFNHLRRRWNWPISASIVAFFFAAIHPQGWTLIPALGSIALALAAIREWRGTAMASMAAHATNNGLVLALVLFVTR
jgi:membrane protease YdiL (CAAX protease family)